MIFAVFGIVRLEETGTHLSILKGMLCDMYVHFDVV